MYPSKFFFIPRRVLQRSRLLQIGVLGGFWLLGEAVSRKLALPVPGGILGLFGVLALLAGGWLRPASVRRGARWLLAEMLLFFVPAVMAVLDHREFLGVLGLKLLAVVVLGTITVMGSTALAVDAGFHWEARHARR
jgi:holin-like protein